jgi:hypothetical protein
MNTRELYSCLRNVQGFLGVFAADRLPKLSNTCCLVANTDPSESPGQHWVCFSCVNGNLYMFDSYGNPPMYYDTFAYFLKNKTCAFSNKCIQSDITNVCGNYCVYFLTKINEGNSPHQISETFGPNLIENDSFIAHWLGQKFNIASHATAIEFLITQFSKSQK